MSRPKHVIAEESLKCSAAIPSARVESSHSVGWTSLLLEQHWLTSSADDYFSTVTPDHTIGVANGGRYDLDMHRGGRWHRSVRQPGSIGMGSGGEPTRGRLHVAPGHSAKVAMLYLPRAQLLDASEHFRRIGQISCEPRLSVIVERDPAITQMVANLSYAMQHGFDDLYAESAATWLAVHLISRHSAGRIDEDTRSIGDITDARIARVIEMMSVRFAEPLTLDEMAREACISKFHFARVFREKTGCTPHAFLADIRMETACRFLRASDLAIADISVACGYPLAVNFAAAFAARFGMSPSAFRHSCRFSSSSHATPLATEPTDDSTA